MTWKEARELEGIEERIQQTEAAVLDAELELNAPDFYRKGAVEIATFQAKLEEKRQQVVGLYARWDELEQKKLASEVM